MTFEDMMEMKRLGDTAVSPDGKWLAYSVTTVNLEQNTKTPELWLQAIAGGEPQKIGVAQPGDSGVQFAPDGHSVLFLSSRDGGQQIWLADFDPATGRDKQREEADGDCDRGRQREVVAGRQVDCVHVGRSIRIVRPITTADFDTGNKCNADRDAALAASKVKAQIFTHLLYRHWDHYTGDKRSHLFLVSVDGGGMRDLNPNDAHDVPPFSLEGGGLRMRLLARLEGAGVYRES